MEKNVKKNGIHSSFFMKCLVVAIVITSLVIFATNMMEYNKYKKEQQVLLSSIDTYTADIERLEYWIAAPMDKEYVVRVAKEKFGLYMPNEIIYYNDANE